jgi:iron complex outermembrane receptor protein
MSLEWDTPFVPGMTLNARVVGSSSQSTNTNNTRNISGWSRWDLGASYQMQSQPVVIRASVENVLDRDYWESAVGNGILRLAEPRMVSLSATIDF